VRLANVEGALAQTYCQDHVLVKLLLIRLMTLPVN